MILEFCVENFLSLQGKAELSFVASTLKESLPEENDLIREPEIGLSVLRSAVIYGANASGKSNILKALSFYKRFITDSFINSQAGRQIEVEGFRLNVHTENAPTYMEATFLIGDFVYRFGFEVDRKSVKEEWLYQRANKKRAKEVELFYRENGAISVHSKCPLIQEIVDKKMIRDNALVLSTAAQFNDPKSVEILNWLSDTQVLFCSEDESLWEQAIKHLDDDTVRDRITEFAHYADLGIDSISKIDNRIVSSHRQFDENGRESGNVSFPFNKNESEGTIKYVSLAYPIIDALDNGKRVVIDELDSKLHPLLVRKIITLFNSSKTNPKGAQLLFTTHDTFLLGAGLLRRDQIWFTQKDGLGATSLYSLAEYKVRSNSAFDRDYINGKYGATPIIGEIEKVFERDR